jgi:hypothetical protein
VTYNGNGAARPSIERTELFSIVATDLIVAAMANITDKIAERRRICAAAYASFVLCVDSAGNLLSEETGPISGC